MFDYINGKITDKTESTVTVEVCGVGFELFVTSDAYDRLKIGETQKVYTHMNVREDEISLFGFSSREEKRLFNKLISVSGVGPKSAISILSGDSLEHIVFYIATGDSKSLSKIKGLGKKTAEKIIIELRDKVDSSAAALDDSTIGEVLPKSSGELQEAITGLMSLGFTKIEAENGVKAAIADGAQGLEKIVSVAIKKML